MIAFGLGAYRQIFLPRFVAFEKVVWEIASIRVTSYALKVCLTDAYECL